MSFLIFHKSHTRSRIQVLLGLCVAVCMIFLSGNHIVKAVNPSQQWGSFYSDKSPRRCTVPGDSQVLSLLDMIQMYYPSYQTTQYQFFPTYNDLFNSLESNGLLTYFTNWDPYNPQYYINIEYVSGWSSTSGGYGGYYIYLSKSNQDFAARSASFGVNSSESGQAYFEFLSSSEYTNFISFDFSMRDLVFMSPFVITYPTYNDGSSKYYNANIGSRLYPSEYSVFQIQYNANPAGYGNLIAINSIPHFNRTSANDYFFPTHINSWLNDTSTYFLTLYIDASPYNNFVVNDRGVNNPSVTHFPIFSQFATYEKNDVYSTQLTDVNNNDFQYSQRVITFSQSSTFTDDYTPWEISNGQIVYLSYPYIVNLHGLSTPTPIPTWAWTSPTPFPTFIVNATLTPIAFINNPELPIGDKNTFFGNLAGFIGFFGDYFRENPFPQVFAYTSDLIYSFSPVFKFFLIVPVIALIAMIIGRLRRK